jgi:hypothetical protein
VAPLKQAGPDIDNCRKGLKTGEWITTTARVDGAKISVWLNGAFCLDYAFTNPEHLSGNIFALQSHPPYDLVEWDYVKVRKLNVQGCTNPKASNFDPEASKDDGSCIAPVAIASGASVPALAASVRGNAVFFDIPWPGKFTAFLTDAEGKPGGRTEGTGPLRNLHMTIPGSGIRFLDVAAAGKRQRIRLIGAGF